MGMQDALVVRRRVSRKFELYTIKHSNLETGQVKDIELRRVNGFVPIEINRVNALRYTGFSANYIRKLIELGELTGLNRNGTVRTSRKVGSKQPLCFCLEEWLNYEF